MTSDPSPQEKLTAPEKCLVSPPAWAATCDLNRGQLATPVAPWGFRLKSEWVPWTPPLKGVEVEQDHENL